MVRCAICDFGVCQKAMDSLQLYLCGSGTRRQSGKSREWKNEPNLGLVYFPLSTNHFLSRFGSVMCCGILIFDNSETN